MIKKYLSFDNTDLFFLKTSFYSKSVLEFEKQSLGAKKFVKYISKLTLLTSILHIILPV